MFSRALPAIVALTAAIMMARFFEAGDYYDSYRGRRHCAARPGTFSAGPIPTAPAGQKTRPDWSSG